METKAVSGIMLTLLSIGMLTLACNIEPAKAGGTVGVEAGDWVKYDYTVPSGTLLLTWKKVEVLSIEGTTATVRVTMHMSNGTEISDTMTVDVMTEGETFIPANRTTGDSIYLSRIYYGVVVPIEVTIEGETTGYYAGARRTVVYVRFSEFRTELTYYWDKHTGVMMESSTRASEGTGKITEAACVIQTNMWEAAPFWMQWWFYAVVAVGIIALAGAVCTLMKFGVGLAIFLGTILTLVGAYGFVVLAWRVYRFASFQQVGIIFSIVGIIALLVRIVMTHIGFEFSRLSTLYIVLGSCSLIIPAILFGMSHNLAAGIAILVFGYPFLAMIFGWLMTGE